MTNIVTILSKHLGQRTVLGVAIPVLSAHIHALKQKIDFNGLLESEIVIGFRELAGRFIKSDYHPTYIQRRLGPMGFLEINGDRYRIRKRLICDISTGKLIALKNELMASLQTAWERRQLVISKIEEACALPPDCIDARHDLVGSYLSHFSGNRGEMFEVVSFAVLREYFRCFGFSLQRFSTVHSNDGGMDFVGGDAIYQVSVDESAEKLRRDLRKAPGTKRVLVRPNESSHLAHAFNEDVLGTIELQDLLNHFIGWMLERDMKSSHARHLQKVLQIALEEFRRENRAESA